MPITDKGLATRNKIIVTACDLFISQGYHATSTRSIAQAVGMATGAMYNHFQGKDEIFIEVLNKYHPWREIPFAIRKAKGSNPEEFTKDAARILSQIWQKKKNLIKLHLIELIEFQGTHLPPIFKEVFAESELELEKNLSKQPMQEHLSRTAFSQAMLGLFFGLMMTSEFMGVELPNDFSQLGFQYFSDIYLQGYIKDISKKGSSNNIEKK